MNREALALLIQTWPEAETAGAAGTRDETIRLVGARPVDVLILDLHLPGPSLDHFIAELRSVSAVVRVVGLSDREDTRAAADAIRSGCTGYAARDRDAAQLRSVVQRVASGLLAVPPGVDVSAVVRGLGVAAPDSLDQLSARERQVFLQLAEGAKVKQIAAGLGLSPKTVDSYRASLMRKLNVRDLAGLLRIALAREQAQRQPGTRAAAAKSAHAGNSR